MVDTNLEINSQSLNFSFFSVIDSGADHCVFPATFGERLGLDIKTGLHMPAAGFGGGDDLYFHKVKIWVQIEGGAWHWECHAGFSEGMNKLGVGLLGRLGFFELFEEVSFDQNNRMTRLKVHGDKPSSTPPPPSPISS